MSGRRPPRAGDDAPLAPRVREDTIAAVATAPGRAAIAVVRASGADVLRICGRVVEPHGGWPVPAREATRCRIHDVDDPASTIDEGLITVFPAPRSYTGETIIELGVHGGAYVPTAVLAAFVRAGARVAEPGEFTERAVLHGKLDLLRAEAIADLIDARSRSAHRIAMQQLSGALSDHLGSLRTAVIQIEALLAYDVDFPSEDDGALPRRNVLVACDGTIAALDALLATVPAAILGREGATVVLAGPPNAGKSSLLNALAGEARVIVSDTPGTTRDIIEVAMVLGGYKVILADTAGLRKTEDEIEAEGVRRAEAWAQTAGLRVWLVDGYGDPSPEVPAALKKGDIVLLTKRDLGEGLDGLPGEAFTARSPNDVAWLERLLTEAVIEALVGNEPPAATRLRHRELLTEAAIRLRDALAQDHALELAAEDVRLAIRTLDRITGRVDPEDVLGRIFSTFCIGK